MININLKPNNLQVLEMILELQKFSLSWEQGLRSELMKNFLDNSVSLELSALDISYLFLDQLSQDSCCTMS